MTIRHTTALELGQALIDQFENARDGANDAVIREAISTFSIVAFYRANLAKNDPCEFYRHIRLAFLMEAQKVIKATDSHWADSLAVVADRVRPMWELSEDFVADFVPAS